ncbi:RluA family pseudouridine synthase [Rhizosaccharibacter radicis]|uniref:Pseudouridine synthase n=1 Tax=Rhizosaccharibacter radicis TaxID=2782605 RepID=A0ABT1VYM5_9PROT|nr:RluA family pseudouridine synthase [Acetobacteraceae bacterium KSS12]
MSVVQITVTEDENEIRLDRWFRRHYPHLTQGALQKLCRTGQVRVDGKRADTSTRLLPGQAVRVPPIPQAAKPAPAPVPVVDERDVKEMTRMVVYRDDHVIVLNKPSGLPVQGGPGITRHVDGLLDALRFGSEHRPRLVHRIDRDTSGLLLLARTPGVAAKLAAAFRTRDVRKLYWAVVIGRPTPPDGVIDLPLARLGAGPGSLTIAAQRDEDDAAHALTEYATRDSAGRKMSWLELSPMTGRMHQLRVHCEALGTPILGDPKYGVEVPHPDGFAERLHLHARALELPHPAGGRLVVAAELPPHMRETFKALGFTAGATPAAVRR